MFVLPADRPAVMGILNVTPDSFSDGGRYSDIESAVAHAESMMASGADLIDVGGESTRPGAEPVTELEELRRTIPVVDRLVDLSIPVSVDTMKPSVAKAALAAGAQVVNDVSGLRDPLMIETCAATDCTVCVMHMLGEPRSMQRAPVYVDLVRDVREYLVHAAMLAEEAGIDKERIWIDPGIGFGKTIRHNLELIRKTHEFVKTGYPVLIGVSRKSFIGKLLGTAEHPLTEDDRLEGGLAAQLFAQREGARIFRTHDPLPTRRAIEMWRAIEDA